MKTRLSLLLLSMSVAQLSYAQTTIFYDGFDTGATNWTLNSNDLNATSNKNQWIVNNNYTGGNFPNTCYLNGHNNTPATPSQPQGISNPNGNYLHIISNAALASGVLHTNFESGTIDCLNTEETFVKMASPISTLGVTNVECSFWVLKGNSDPGYKGTAYYSIDGGTTWEAFVSNINNYTSWTKLTQTNAQWDNQSSLLFAFSFTNSYSFMNGLFPMAIDDVKVTGDQAPILTITNPQALMLCEGNSSSINVQVNSTYNADANNEYQIYLSDATGSFATELLIGSISSSTAGINTVNCSIPTTLQEGTNYRMRAKSTNPAIISDTTASVITVNSPIPVTFDVTSEEPVICEGHIVTITAQNGTEWVWSDQTEGATIVITLPEENVSLTVQGLDANGCETSGSILVEVQECLSVKEIASNAIKIYPNPVVNKLSIEANTDYEALTIIDMNGRVVEQLNPKSTQWNIEHLKEGKYILLLQSKATVKHASFVKK